MRTILKLVPAIFMIVGIYGSPVVYREPVETESVDEVVDILQQHAGYCVKKILNSKIYFREDLMFINDKGLFIAYDEKYSVRLPMVYSDSSGIFLYIEGFCIADQDRRTET